MTTPTTPSSTDLFHRLADGRVLGHRIDEPALSCADTSPETVVLLHGMGQDLLVWPDDLVAGLVTGGLRVVRVDLRDSGTSSPGSAPSPAGWRIVARRPRPDAYTLDDLAADVCSLVEALDVGPVHLLGASMGGMVAQCIAASRHDLVRSLTSVFSSTGAPGVGGSSRAFRHVLTRPTPRAVSTDPAAVVARACEFVRVMASAQFPPDMAAERRRALDTHLRAVTPGPAGATRHLQAIIASGDRTDACRTITAPTLVVHGDADRVVDVSGGRATAAAVPGARLVEVPGMGHHLAPPLVAPFVEVVLGHVRASLAPPSPPAEPTLPDLLAPRTSPGHHGIGARRTWGARAVVTGAASGIGRALVLELVRRGSRVVCADVDLAGAQETVRLASEAEGSATAVACDVSDVRQVQALADRAVAWFGMPTLLVNNAGVGVGHSLVGETATSTWERATAVNLMGVVHGCETFVPLLRRTAGPRGVLNVASAAGFAPSPGMAAYGVGKAGVIALTETLAAEFAGTDLSAAVTCPTFVETPIFDGALMDPESARFARQRAASSGVDAATVARTALDALDRGALHHFPQRDARRFWLLKRCFPTQFPQWAATAAARTTRGNP